MEITFSQMEKLVSSYAPSLTFQDSTMVHHLTISLIDSTKLRCMVAQGNDSIIPAATVTEWKQRLIPWRNISNLLHVVNRTDLARKTQCNESLKKFYDQVLRRFSKLSHLNLVWQPSPAATGEPEALYQDRGGTLFVCSNAIAKTIRVAGSHQSLTSLVIDTASFGFRNAGHERDQLNVCHEVAKLLPRLKELRLRIRGICPLLLEQVLHSALRPSAEDWYDKGFRRRQGVPLERLDICFHKFARTEPVCDCHEEREIEPHLIWHSIQKDLTKLSKVLRKDLTKLSKVLRESRAGRRGYFSLAASGGNQEDVFFDFKLRFPHSWYAAGTSTTARLPYSMAWDGARGVYMSLDPPGQHGRQDWHWHAHPEEDNDSTLARLFAQSEAQ